MIPSQVIAAGVIKDTDRVSLDALTAATETIIPIYAFIPRGAMPNGISTSIRGGSVRFDWYVNGTSTCVAGDAGATLTFKLYWGSTPGTGTATLTAGYPITFPLNATQGFALRISAQTTNEPSGTADAIKMSVELASVVTPTSGGVAVRTDDVYFGNTPNATFTTDTYLWLTVTGTTAGSSSTTFFDPRSVVCVAHGLQPLSLEQ